MKEIVLTKGMVALCDDEDFEWLSKYKWYANKGGNGFYALRDKQYKNIKTHIHMHREILGTPNGMETDHRDGNSLNNQRYNLRVSTKSQNNANRKPVLNVSSKYKGVSYRKDTNKWRAYVKIDRKNIHLGTFKSELEAALAYDRACIELFGDFARPNFTNHKQQTLFNQQSF